MVSTEESGSYSDTDLFHITVSMSMGTIVLQAQLTLSPMSGCNPPGRPIFFLIFLLPSVQIACLSNSLKLGMSLSWFQMDQTMDRKIFM